MASEFKKGGATPPFFHGAVLMQRNDSRTERCAVRVRLSMTMLTPPFIGQKIVNLVDETWVREDGQWWFYQAL